MHFFCAITFAKALTYSLALQAVALNQQLSASADVVNTQK
jgi:hypothetical protein